MDISFARDELSPKSGVASAKNRTDHAKTSLDCVAEHYNGTLKGKEESKTCHTLGHEVLEDDMAGETHEKSKRKSEKYKSDDTRMGPINHGFYCDDTETTTNGKNVRVPVL